MGGVSRSSRRDKMARGSTKQSLNASILTNLVRGVRAGWNSALYQRRCGPGSPSGRSKKGSSPRVLAKRSESPGFRGYPVATIAFYGPDNQRASKVAVGIVLSDDADPVALERWYSEESDVRSDPTIGAEIFELIQTPQDEVGSYDRSHHRMPSRGRKGLPGWRDLPAVPVLGRSRIGLPMTPSTDRPNTSFQRTHTRGGFGPLNSDRRQDWPLGCAQKQCAFSFLYLWLVALTVPFIAAIAAWHNSRRWIRMVLCPVILAVFLGATISHPFINIALFREEVGCRGARPA